MVKAGLGAESAGPASFSTMTEITIPELQADDVSWPQPVGKPETFNVVYLPVDMNRWLLEQCAARIGNKVRFTSPDGTSMIVGTLKSVDVETGNIVIGD